jgi:lipoyl-dependent peroxiredoxin
MKIRQASAVWEGPMMDGQGKVQLGSGLFEHKYSVSSRFEDGPGTNPEELLGAAHAACFSMALAGILSKAGFPPKRISTTARVTLDTVAGGPKITEIELVTEAEVPGLDGATFLEHAEKAKAGCPVSQALAATKIKLSAALA